MSPVTRRSLIASAAAQGLVDAAQSAGVVRYVRFLKGGAPAYGMLEGDTIRPLSGGLFANPQPSGVSVKLSSVKLLYPVNPSKVLAVGRNYKSHIGTAVPSPHPDIFYKPVSCLIPTGENIVIPSDSKNTHYEGELVLIIGKKASNVTVQQARDYIFGVTCGNDVSERDWQGGPNKDMQWWRAKGADTFGPLGPCIARGLDYGNLKLTTRLNGQPVQQAPTSDLIHDCHTIVSFISRYVTLLPGDVIYTGTPGTTQKMKPGDVVEVEIEGIGTLRNSVTQG
ncbi:MAG: fumarylacetoacetate hydrolase family protein [Acidobacteria bacterium]|nr:fumarylacetoacetate hydrolase family protein [Acidobacteriota bacterium]